MPIDLTPVAAERFSAWLERSRDEYTADLVAAGETPESAFRHATEALARAFPEHVPTDGQAVFDLIDDSADAVGYLWLGHDTSEDPTSWWVWDVVVDPEHRGQGLNAAARAPYDSLGYETTSVKMRKQLGVTDSCSSPVLSS